MPSFLTVAKERGEVATPAHWEHHLRSRNAVEPLRFNPHGSFEESRVADRLLIEVRDLPFSTRALACMGKLGIVHVGDLIPLSPEILLSQGNFGRRSLRELAGTLSRVGFRLRQQVDGWPPEDLPEVMARRRDSIGTELGAILIPRAGAHVEGELRQLAVAAGPPRNVAIVLRCLGWDGRGGATMEVVGQEYRMSRQRVSQIVRRVRGLYQRVRIVPTRLEHCLRIATPRLAENACTVEDRLIHADETRVRFRLEGLLKAAKTFQMPAPFELVSLEGMRVVVRRGKAPFLFTAIRRAMVASSGADSVSIRNLAAQLRNRYSVRDLADLLPLHPRFEWRDDLGRWFGFRPARGNG